MDIAEVRQKFPEYSDLSDDQLAQGLHKKFYSDVPYEEFSAKIGLSAQTKSDQTIEKFRSEKPASNSLLQQGVTLAKENAPLIGSVAGGIIGAAGGPAGSAALGSLLGTVAGTSIGTSVKQLDEQSRSGSKPVKTLLGEQARNISEQALYDLMGTTIGAGIAKGINAAIPKAREGADIAQRMLTSKGGSLSMAQATDSPTLNLAESFARAGAGGKGQFISLDKRNADALQAIKGDLISIISKDPINDRVAGKLFQDAISKGDAAHSIAATALYKDFDTRVGNAIVDSTPVQRYGLELADQFKRIGDVGKSDAGGRLIDQLKSIPKNMTFSDAQALRSNLLATIRDLKVSGTEAKALRTATIASTAVDKAMEESARKLPGDVYAQFRQINAFYKKGKEAFSGDVIRDLVAKEPERVGEALFKSGNVSEIIQAKASLRQAANFDKTVDNDAIFSRLRSGYLDALLTTKSATNKEGETVAQNLLKELATAKTNRQFSVMFNEAQRKAIGDFGRTAFLTLQNKPSQFGILAPLLQAAAIGDLISSAAGGPGTKSPLADIGLIVSPAVLGKILTNPKAVNALTMAIQLPPAMMQAGSPMFIKLAGQLRNGYQESVSEPAKATPIAPQGQTTIQAPETPLEMPKFPEQPPPVETVTSRRYLEERRR